MKEENDNAGKNAEEKAASGKKNNENALITKESIGAVGALFSALAFLILATRSLIFGDVGMAVNSFLLGVFGYGAYFFVPLIFILSVAAFIGKRIFKNKPAAVFSVISLFIILLIVHGVVTASWQREGYFSACFTAAEGGVKTCSPAGWLGGLLVGALFAVSGKAGTFVILAMALVCFFALTARTVSGRSVIGAAISKIKSKKATKTEVKSAENTQVNPNGDFTEAAAATANPSSAAYGAFAREQNGAQRNDAQNYGGAYDASRSGDSTPYNYPYNNNAQGAYDNRGANGYSASGGFSAGNRTFPAYEKRNEYGFPADNVRQRPGVTLSKNISDRTQNFGGNFTANPYNGVSGAGFNGQPSNPSVQAPDSFSPFGSSYYGNNADGAADNGAQPVQNGRDLIYGGDAVESFRNNLIFDPDSKFNRRKSAANEPIPAARNFAGTPAAPRSAHPTAPTASNGFGGSYTDSYADSVNGNYSQERVVSDKQETNNNNNGTYFRATPENPVSSGTDFTRGATPPAPSGTNASYSRETSDFSSRGTSGTTDFTSFDSRNNQPADDFSGSDSRNDFTADTGSSSTGRFTRDVSRDDISADNLSRGGADFTSYNDFSGRNGGRGDDFSASGRGTDFGGESRDDRNARGEDFTSIFDDEEDSLSSDRGGRSSDFTSADRSSDFTSFSSREDSVRGLNDDLRDFGSSRDSLRDGGDIRASESDDFSKDLNPGADRGESDISGVDSRGTDVGARGAFTPAQPERPVSRPAPVPPPPPAPKPRVVRPYKSAPLDYFDCTETRPDQNSVEIDENKATILDTLEAFKVPDASIASVTCGPTVTRYNVAVPRNISPKKVVALDQPIAMNLHAKNGVNIAPNFEDGTISVEVPNKKRQTVTLGSMLVADEYINSKPNALVFAMGKTVDNVKTYGDIRKMTHVLVAGTSGSGKTAFLHSIIISLIMKYSPADLRLILIDPKKTEFVVYEGLPHLVINEVLSDTNKVIQSLNWAIAEMERRYDLFSKKSRSGTYVIDIDEYNANLTEGEEKLPKIVIIADEVAAMMQDAKKDMEDRIQNLTQKSRATGIHVILATQRPSTDVITGVIKSNLKSRIALSVAQEIDSRVILDESGAQNLLGQGDLLYSTEGTKTPIRMQAPFISSEKAQEVIRYIKENNDCYFNEEAAAFIDKPKGQSGGFGGDSSEDDEVDYVYIDALRNVILSGSASISLVQRKCSVGYNKAGKIIEWMEDQGYISAFDGAKARKVLITPEQFEEKYGPL